MFMNKNYNTFFITILFLTPPPKKRTTNRFNDMSTVERWNVTSDMDNQGGKSTANFTYSKNGTGIFHGYLSKEVPQDGKTKYAGYANISAPKPFVRHKYCMCMNVVNGSFCF